MRIAICASMDAIEKIMDIADLLSRSGHDVVIPKFVGEHKDISKSEVDRIRKDPDFIENHKHGYIRKHFDEIKNSDAILVVNVDKKGIRNYIGGATFAEMMLAFYLNKKIFLMNPIPNDPKLEPYLDELNAIKPTVIHGKLGMVK